MAGPRSEAHTPVVDGKRRRSNAMIPLHRPFRIGRFGRLIVGGFSKQCLINKAPYGFLDAHYEALSGQSKNIACQNAFSKRSLSGVWHDPRILVLGCADSRVYFYSGRGWLTHRQRCLHILGEARAAYVHPHRHIFILRATGIFQQTCVACLLVSELEIYPLF